MIDWLSFNRNQILISLSVIISGLLGFMLGGPRWCFYSIVGVICLVLIIRYWNGLY